MRQTPATGPFNRDRLGKLMDKMAQRRIVVIGDVMLDRYLIGDTERLSPEAPVPVLMVHERRSALGGAANVAANVAAIGATGCLVGVVGDDQDGQALRQEMAASQLDDRFLLTLAGRPTTSKTRVVARGQQVVRIDEEVDTLLDDGECDKLIAKLNEALEGADALLLEDYNKGALTPAVIKAALAAARKRGIPTVVDPKFRQFFAYEGATVFKPNRRELEAAMGAAMDLKHQDAIPQALERLKVDNLLLTLGADGMLLVTKDRKVSHIPSIAREVYDVSGAGDTVTAWVGTAIAAGASLYEAAHIATYAAGIEVAKAGTATVNPKEVLTVHEERFDQIGRLRREGLI
ncbi:MAG TPA: D-glycero-beta-D-manno-heptose-7-phosphate kinase [Gemmatimonadales bacterium]|nr:D-glycero-beta-D-manno-heptose-7-phosphate kinase [Gemmatimonadales bacterium]